MNMLYSTYYVSVHFVKHIICFYYFVQYKCGVMCY
jgi:hypothetical protein